MQNEYKKKNVFLTDEIVFIRRDQYSADHGRSVVMK